MKQVDDKISISELKAMAERMYGSIVKADVDIAKNILVIDMDMHADGEAFLLDEGSKQEDLWGINLHPDKYGTNEFIEFDSMINIRPRQQNPSRDVLDQSIRTEVARIVSQKVHE
jgi:hypothetical protein